MASSIQQQMFTALAGHAGVSGIVGSRVYPDVAPQDAAVPFVVWQEISLLKAGNSLAGSSESGGLDNFRVQVTSWAKGANGASAARDLDYQVRLAMIAATGIKCLHTDSRAMQYEPDVKRHGMQSDFSVWLRT